MQLFVSCVIKRGSGAKGKSLTSSRGCRLDKGHIWTRLVAQIKPLAFLTLSMQT